MSSTASILSGRSFGSRRITLRVDISVDYDGPSLSDTSSLASLDDFKIVNSSQQLLSFGTSPIEVDDDSVTVSSRDPGLVATQTLQTSQRSISKQKSSHSYQITETLAGDVVNGHTTDARIWAEHEFDDISIENEILSVSERFPSDPSAVFERLKLSETLADKTSSVESDRLAASNRGAAWLRDQNERAIRSKLGALPELSDSESFSLSLDESLGGDLALQRDPRGRYYYSYTIGSSASQAHGSVYDEGQQSNAGDAEVSLANSFPRPTSLHLNWLASQRIEADISSSGTSDGLSMIDFESLPFQSPPEDTLTDCSNCGVLLDAMRYVCSTCGPKPTVKESTSDKGKDKEDSPVTAYAYSLSSHKLFSSPNFSTSQTIIATASSYEKPLPSLPSSLPSALRSYSSGSQMHLNTSSAPSSPTRRTNGYELCVMCLESVGINHAINEAGLAAIGSPNMSPTSHRDPHLASQWRRAAPKKGQMRHAYKEKVWSQCGWEDVGTLSSC